MAVANIEIAKKLYADYAAKDIPAVLGVLSPDIRWTVSGGFPYAGTYTSGDAIVANVFAKVPEEWDGFKHELTGFVDSGDRIAVTGVYSGTWKKTGRDMTAPFVHILDIQDGKLVKFQQLVDGPSVAEATDGFEHGVEAAV